MTTSHQQRKQKALHERIAVLEKQWQAANDELNAESNLARRETLKLQIALIGRDIEQAEQELAALAPAESTRSKANPDVLPPPSPRLFGQGKRWAVLVGVDYYEDYGRLLLAVKDVTAVRDRLLKSGYDAQRIHLLTDKTPSLPTRNNILAALLAIANATEEDDLLLFYYSGHGDATEGKSYLVGSDGYRLALSDTAISLNRVEEILRNAKARGKVIVIDACHSGADIGSKGFSDEFIRHVFEQAEGLAILTSCKQGELSWEDPAFGHGVFTHFVLEALTGAADHDQKGFVTAQDLNRHVSNGVRAWAAKNLKSQTPTFQPKMAGDIIIADLRPTQETNA